MHGVFLWMSGIDKAATGAWMITVTTALVKNAKLD